MMKWFILIWLSIGLYGGSFDYNTDKKSDYEFDSDTKEQNDKLTDTLERFKQHTVSQDELQQYIDKKTFSKEKYAKDVIIIYAPGQKKATSDENNETSSKSWYNIF